MLRRVAGKRPRQHSYERKGARFGVQHLTFSLEYPLRHASWQRFGTMEVSEAANGKYQEVGINGAFFASPDPTYRVCDPVRPLVVRRPRRYTTLLRSWPS